MVNTYLISEVKKKDKSIFKKKCEDRTLAGVVQWIERQPVNQGVASSIPSQGTSLGCGPGPEYRTHKRQPHIDVSLLLFLPPFPSV